MEKIIKMPIQNPHYDEDEEFENDSNSFTSYEETDEVVKPEPEKEKK